MCLASSRPSILPATPASHPAPCPRRADEEHRPMTQTTPATHTFAKSPDPSGEDRAYLDFVLGLKQHWARTLYPQLREQYDAAIGQPGAARPVSVEEAGPVVQGLPAYPFFGWLERN